MTSALTTPSEPRGIAGTFRAEVRSSDVEAVRAVVTSSGFFLPAEIDVAVELVQARLTHGEASGYHFLFAEEAGHVVGYACFGPIACTQASFDLYWIAVEQTRRGGGVGRELLERTERMIRDLGGRRVYIETSSRALYEPTRAFYLRRGYSVEATLRDFYAAGDDKVIFVKSLGIQRK